MRSIAAFLASLLAFVGCVTTVVTPTPDIPATVAAAVEAALPTATPNYEATVEASLQATITALPTPTGIPTPTPTPTSVPTASPTRTPRPRFTPTPTPHPSIPIFGPASGTLVHEPDDRRFELFRGVTTGEDVMIEATFFNPYPTTKGSWSYGFLLRNSRFGYYHRVLVQSKGAWIHRLRLGTGRSEDLRSERSDNVDRTPEGKNHLRVITIGDEGWVYINGVFEGNINLSELTEPFNNFVVLGDEMEGEATRFEGFTIWKWHPSLATLPKGS